MLQKNRTLSAARIAISALAIATVGCSPTDKPSSTPPTAAPEKAAPTATAVQWLAATASVYDKVNVKKLRDKTKPEYVLDEGKTDSDGVTEFFGCFDKSPPKCDLPVSGKRDGFRKVQFFTDPVWELSYLRSQYANGVGKPSVRGYISMTDCKRPKIVLQPTFQASSWLFLEQFSLMLDGNVVVDRKFSTGEVDRNNNHNSVSEVAHITLSDQELQSLRSMAPSKPPLMRLTGKKGYIGIDSEMSKTVALGFARLLLQFDALDKAILAVGNVADASCPN